MDKIKELRDETGVSVMQCKRALEEAGGDREKALLVLRKASSAIAAKKTGRELGAGVVAAYVHNNGAVAALVSLHSETDFVARNEDFRKLAYEIAMHVAASNPEFLSTNDVTDEARAKLENFFAEEVEKSGKPPEIKKKIVEGKISAHLAERILLEQPYIREPDITVGGLLERATQKFGERVVVGKFVRMSA
ncbi:elongation factor Ts [bacterium]|nr:elongation factor Ts [bacterium]MCI0565891.1 elongation factor Ts [bacterium]MCI0680261.1 elongation factor Ts [bacterium]